MNITRNDSLIKRNARIGRACMLGGLLVLMGGMYISFQYPEQVSISLVMLLFGFILSQVGIFYTNRWGRKPRPDEMLDSALKGMDKKYTLYHYATPVNHLLVGPSGLWVLLPYYQRGMITYKKGRWRQSGGGLGYAYLKVFAQEGLGRPDLEAASESKALLDYLKKRLPEEEIPPVQVALVFTDPRTTIQPAEEAELSAEAVMLKDLKDVVRRTGKAGKGLAPDKVRLIQDALLEA
ncbi:MAG: hypothetical protein ACKOC5_01850 [Chloroflexota bacterium]